MAPLAKLSLGCSAFGSVFSEMSDDDCIEIIEAAFTNGVTLLDTAPWYQTSEIVLGRCLARLAPRYPRGMYTLNTKVGRYCDWHPDGGGGAMFDFSRKTVLAGFATSLERLQTDYVDTIQIHDLEFAEDIEQVLNETLPALDELRAAGKARRIGITSYDVNLLRTVCERSPVRIDSVLSYCRCTLNDRTLLESGFVDYLKSQGIELINAAAVGMGLLCHNDPPDWHPAPAELKARAVAAAKYCQEHGVDLAKLALSFCFTQPQIQTTLVSCVNMQQMGSNLAVLKQGLTAKEQACLQTVLKEFFPSSTHWEGVELAAHRAEQRALAASANGHGCGSVMAVALVAGAALAYKRFG